MEYGNVKSLQLLLAALLLFCTLSLHLTSAQTTDGDEDTVFCEGSTQKIRASWICDGHPDCDNGADERRCARNCNQEHFTCTDGQCIRHSWLCDGNYDCDDRSDENPDTCSMTVSDRCFDFQFDCQNDQCVRQIYVCDGTDDCENGLDEQNCATTAAPVINPLDCSQSHFACDDKCIPLSWKCDGESDCTDGSDEFTEECAGIVTECGFGFFNCSNGGCININSVCDGNQDCPQGDTSDEEGCPALVCSEAEFECPNRAIGCIPRAWVCDGSNDCGNHEDEVGCEGVCQSNEIACVLGGCVNATQLCDGVVDCEDGSDEFKCIFPPPPINCPLEEFACHDNESCVNNENVCDGTFDCLDGSDESTNLCGPPRGGSGSGSGSGVFLSGSGCEFHSCDQNCVASLNPDGGRFCTCDYGYLVDRSDLTSCIDYDECSQPDRCSQVCNNWEGGFNCSCADGYVIGKRNNKYTCLAASGPPAKLLFANRVDIRSIRIDGSNSELLVKRLHNVIAIDFHYRLELMFWTDIVQETINWAWLNGSNATAVVSNGLKDPVGLAVDWINDKLYWADADTAKIEVSNLDGSNRTVLFANNIGILRAVIVDPTTRYIFWTDWGVSPRIERASMDGQDRITLHSYHLAWPNALTIDYATQTLYWADAKLLTIESSLVDGSMRRPIRTSHLRHPFAMTMFEDTLYWTDWQSKSVFNTTKFARSFVYNSQYRTHEDQLGKNATEMVGDLFFPMDIKVVHPLRQPMADNPCGNNSGGCEYLCLISAVNEEGYTCTCPPGIRVAEDGKSCEPLENFILFARRTEIFRVSLDISELIDVPLNLANLSGATALDWDDETDKVFWTDLSRDTINCANSNGTNQTVLINQNLYFPAGLAVDWITRKLYWTEHVSAAARIEVANLNGTDRAIVVLSERDNPIHKPRDIVVHPTAGLMFWTDWGDYPKIERANLDGSDRFIIATENLTYPNGLAIDYESNLIYWCDAGTDVIEYSDFYGEGRTMLIIEDDVPHPFGLAIFQNLIYWTDWFDRSIHRADKLTGESREVLFKDLDHRPMDIHIYHRNRSRAVTPCSVDNGGCSHHCLSRPSETEQEELESSCVCPVGHTMMSDGKTCNSDINSYLLFPIGNNLHEISLDTSDRHLIDFIVNVADIQAVTSVAVDIMTDEIYWADRVESKIFKASRLGGPRIPVISADIIAPESIAIDWIGRKLYWVDSSLARIEVSNLDGSMRLILFWTNLVHVTSIAIDLESFHMFWSDAGNVAQGIYGKIERADMDGNNRITIVTSHVGSPKSVAVYNPTGLGGRIYWTDSFHGSIDTTDLHGRDRFNLITFSQSDDASLQGLAVEADYIYWTDVFHNSINRARRSDGSEQIKIVDNAASVTDVKVISKSDISRRADGFIDHPCDGTNQGCSHLCLPNPGLSKYSCACTTGIALTDTKTCRDLPPIYMLIAARRDVRRISLDPEVNNYNDVSLVSGLNNTLALDYRLTGIGEGQMMFADKIYDTIYVANLNGSDVRPLITDITSVEGIAYDWLGKNIYWVDTIRNTLEVARYDGRHRKVLVSAQDALLDRPRGITLDPARGVLFIADWSYVFPRIASTKMDGSGFRLIIKSGLKWPNGVAVDTVNVRIYWIDAYYDRLESATYSGGDRRVLINKGLVGDFHPFGIVFFNGFVFWSNIFNATVHQARVRNNELVSQVIIHDRVHNPAQFQIVSDSSPRPGELTPIAHPGPCYHDNGGCAYLCLANDETGRVCACPDDLEDCVKEVVTNAGETTHPVSDSVSTENTGGPTHPPKTPPPIEFVTLDGPGTGPILSFQGETLTDSPNKFGTAVVVSMVVITFIMFIIIVIIVTVTVIVVRRQGIKNKRQQRQLETMRKLQSQSSYGKLNSMSSTQRVSGTFTNSNPESVIGNLLPKRHNNNSNEASQRYVQQPQPQPDKTSHKHRFHFHRNSSSSTKRASANVANTNVFMEEPEVYQLPPKPQPKRKVSVPDSPPLKKPARIKPPAPLPPGFEEKEGVVVVEVEVAMTTDDAKLSSAPPPPRPPKKSLSSSSDTGASSGEPSPISGRKPRSCQSKKVREKSCERGVHFDPSLPKEVEPPPLPPRGAVVEDVPIQQVSAAPAVPKTKKSKPLPISSHVVTVEATVEREDVDDNTPPPSYREIVQMEPLSDCTAETSSLEGGGGSDCTVSTELGHEVVSVGGEVSINGRHSSPESCESSC